MTDTTGEGVSPPTDTPAQAGRKAAPTKVLVIFEGRRRMFPVDQAERLIRLGHARRP